MWLKDVALQNIIQTSTPQESLFRLNRIVDVWPNAVLAQVDVVIGADGANSRVAKDIEAGDYEYAIAFQDCCLGLWMTVFKIHSFNPKNTLIRQENLDLTC